MISSPQAPDCGPLLALPAAVNDYQAAFIAKVAASFARVTGKSLIEEAGLSRQALGQSAWSGDFALLCHRGGAQAMLNYGNEFALRLWECDWDGFTSTPSSATAPEQALETRELLMERVLRDSFVSGYCGERVSRTGRRFVIEDVTVWRLLDESGNGFGMGAFFRRYRYLERAAPMG
jgi:hypothetical protein